MAAKSNIKLAISQDLRGLKATDAGVKKTAGGIKKLSGVVQALGLTMGAAGIGQILRKSSEAYIQQEQAVAQLEAGLRSTNNALGMSSKAVQQMAADLQKLTLFGDESTIEMVSLLTTFTKIGAETAPRASKAILDVAQRMGMDLKSAAVQVGKALNDPATGLSMLTRVGITFSESQKVAIKSLMEMGDVAGAQALILDELETQFGGSAEAAAQAAGGGFLQFKNMLGDVSENVGPLTLQLDSLARALAQIGGSEDAVSILEGVSVAATTATSLGVLSKILDALARDQSRFNKEMRDAGKLQREILRTSKANNISLKDAAVLVAKNSQTWKHWNRELDATGTGLDAVSDAAVKMAAEMHFKEADDAAAKVANLRDRIADLKDEITLLVNREKLAASETEATAGWFDELAKSVNGAAAAISSVDVSAWMAGIGDGGGFESLSDGFLEAMDAGAARFRLAQDIKNQLKDDISWSFSAAIRQAIDGDVRGALQNLFSNLGASLGNSIALSMGASAGGFGATLGAGLVGMFAGYIAEGIFGSKFKQKFGGVIDDFAQTVGIFRQAARGLQDAIIAIVQVTGGLLDLQSITTQQFGPNDYRATLSGARSDEGPIKFFPTTKVTGSGTSPQEAIDDLIRQLVETIKNGANEGLVDLIGFEQFFVTAIKNSGAASMAELQQAINAAAEIFKAGLGPAHAAVFEAFNNLGAMAAEAARLGLAGSEEFANAIKNGIQGAISGLAGADLYPAFADAEAVMETFTAGLEKLGIVGKEAKQYLSDAATALEVYNSRLKSDVLQQIVGVFSNIPKLAEKAAAIQAQVDQARMVIEIAISKIRLRELFESGLIQKGLFAELRKGLRQAGRWAKDLDHFIAKVPAAVASPNVTVVVPDAGTGVGGGGGTGGGVDSASRETRNWQAFKAWLAARGLDWREIPAADLAAFKDEWRRDPSGGFERAPAGGGTGGGGGIVQTFRDIWTALIDGLREFQKSLNLSSFAPGTPRELAGLALGNVKDLFAKAMGGDTDALKAFQAAAQQALTLGSAAFGTSTGYFQETFFQAIQTMIDQLKAVDPADVDPAKNPTVGAVKDQTTALVGSLDSVGARIFAMQKSTESRLDKLVLAFERSGGMVPAT